MQLLPSEVVERFAFCAVFQDGPGEKLIEVVLVHVRAGDFLIDTRLRKRLGADQCRILLRINRFARPGKSSVRAARIFVGVRLLIPLEVVPLREDGTAETIDDWREVAGGGVVQQKQVAVCGIEAPEARHDRRRFVFIVLRMKMAFTTAWAVRGKDNPVVRPIDRGDVVVVWWLVRHLGDDGRLVFSEAGDFVELPDKVLNLELLCRRADRH